MRIALLRRIPDEIYKELLTALAKVGSHWAQRTKRLLFYLGAGGHLQHSCNTWRS